ncbi:nucleoside-diphosphate sugar epimerase/dehydratase [Lentisphaerota bacterium WC36G]|nr:polysaccharide biosynthesis protein [Lentisphaerae bacterium WC36]
MSDELFMVCWRSLPIILCFKAVAIFLMRRHRLVSVLTSLYDIFTVVKINFFISFIFATFWLILMQKRYHIPYSVFALDFLNSIILISLLKMSARLSYEGIVKKLGKSGVNKVLIVGAGSLGVFVANSLNSFANSNQRNVAVGFLDDDKRKWKYHFQGIKVLGTISDIVKVVEQNDVDTVLFAINHVPKKIISQCVEHCRVAGLQVKFQKIPDISTVVDASSLKIIPQEINIDDLLGRDPVVLDLNNLADFLHGKIILITGAGGSIGSELARKVAGFDPKKLLLLDMAESALFKTNHDVVRINNSIATEEIICDIKDKRMLENVFQSHKIDIVYHAAAYKHVPLMEKHIDLAILNNIIGTKKLAMLSANYKVKNFVMISTDKAVRPTNVMGATKRICELLIQSMNGKDVTKFSSVRFGNVLGSNGSVIPLFIDQIKAGGPVTITHKDITRYFMSIPEAAMLVLECSASAEASDIFVLEMGDPVKIMTLAEKLLDLLNVNDDIEIKIIGLRPGEKMFEELITYGEEAIESSIPRVQIIKKTAHIIDDRQLDDYIKRLEEYALDKKLEKCRDSLNELLEKSYV